ncbi:M20 aminoacylase family protein [Rhizobium rhizogenes]|uniref:Hyppurate hydrolase protein n=1 Tax=Rhizobium rhizogenes (strain K84 / ATCC BAA-868) TaxID=311403 RepID=B9JMH2_RHIR8|nr:M20 aminoacylase family protein [Rhizobium rhizogenes]ACM28560.1 hyppurate hydrolase protein [Rhizobium rhizogenes K84]MDJ1637053.1 M20 aminoacylase family protein [Rhizobium rhizogenes]NTI45900.1 amidohydrolase [Rhizobium rhizogenes]OCJ22268.1 amidohydrolase [Agrobacterium sp. B131/95]
MKPSEASLVIADEAKIWRRDIHQHPEILFDLPRTSALVAEKLREFGCDEVVTGIATSGVVAVISGNRGAGKTIGLRCDMDALPMSEQTNLPYASKVPNMMHACGHDGHTAILLGAAKRFATERNFAGKIVLVFQPAEEGGGGGRVMLGEGLLERFGIEEVYGMHNQPGLDVGSFAIRSGPMMAAGDRFVITMTGLGGHAATPHLARDPVLAASHLVVALQSIASRFIDPLDSVVVSVTFISGGDRKALNVIPPAVEIGGTIRTMLPATRRAVEQRFRDVVNATAALYDAEAAIDWRPGYPVTVNDVEKTSVAIAAAESIVGAERVDGNWPMTMGSEDFSYMLEKRPGAMIWLGNGDSADLHNPAYNFNDDAIAYGIDYWAAVVAQRQSSS